MNIAKKPKFEMVKRKKKYQEICTIQNTALVLKK